MRFATRTFLWSFIPVALLLAVSFGMIQKLTVSRVRDELRGSLRRSQLANAQMRARSELQNSRFLSIVGDNAPLKAGVQLMAANPSDLDARRTVEDQLREICENLSFDFLLATDAQGRPLAGVVRKNLIVAPADPGKMQPPERGFYTDEGVTYQVTSVAVNQAGESIGTLAVGERFDFSGFSTPAVLTRNGTIVKSTVPGASPAQLQAALAPCHGQSECEVRLAGQTYLSLSMDSIYFGDGYLLRSLQNVDSASGPLQSILLNVFVAAGVGATLAALALSVLSSRSIVRPIATLIAKLRASVTTGVLPRFEPQGTPILEIRELMQSFNRAAGAVEEGEYNLHRAYVEFVGSLANALDARDRYTAGHSRRVSEGSCAIARTLLLPAEQVAEIRMAALLHDIGKIGIADAVLQKPGKLTDEEFTLIKEHPTIGRHILEGVHGFHQYLEVVELHHENWDGTGYPRGLSGNNVPLGARIVHIVDAYDAMTSDRPYRKGMSHLQAMSVLRNFAGTQFDPTLVQVFEHLAIGYDGTLALNASRRASLDSLVQALSAQSAHTVLRTPA